MPALDEQRLGKQVEEALGAETLPDDRDPLFVEAGLERVSDGIHAESVTTRGKDYQLRVACAGKGKITLSVASKKPTRRIISCDGVPASRRIADSPGRLRIDAEGVNGAVGMIGWRIDKVKK
ncbi:hypothetical protein ACF1A5_02320 [Streptomyces sp. NPDC014864]|uniref:hypothetical protein n=1 Tax=Streptomyces sp. NPDC014864 TaxID=3364924 RepID=UPI003700A70C